MSFISTMGSSYVGDIRWPKSKRYRRHWKEFEKEPLAKLETTRFTFVFGETMKIGKTKSYFITKASLQSSPSLMEWPNLWTGDLWRRSKRRSTTRKYPLDLLQKGKIALSRKDNRPQNGRALYRRTFIKRPRRDARIHRVFLEPPRGRPFYRRNSIISISTKSWILNKRLDVVMNFEILSNEINHQRLHASKWLL